MTPPRPPIRNCPICRIAMVGSRSSPERSSIDIFHCLRCDTQIRLDPPPDGGTSGRDRG